ncbi:MAG: ZIP family metal transporter [Luteibaculum sp.]
MPVLRILLLLFCTLVPGFIVFGGNARFQAYIKPLLSLSGSFLLALSFCHLLPDAYQKLGVSAGLFVLIGFFMQVALEHLTKGVEHGHFHSHQHFSKLFPVLAISGLTLHSVVESLPMLGHQHNENSQYLLGILLHKAPIALTLAAILLSAPLSKTARWAWFLMFALSAPLTLVLGSVIPNISLDEVLITQFAAVAVGIFLHVATTILFEQEDGHRLNLGKFAAIISGLIIFYFSL